MINPTSFNVDTNGLPSVCVAVHPSDGGVVYLCRGVMGYSPMYADLKGMSPSEFVDLINRILGVLPCQREAMLAGSMFRWDCPAASPFSYDRDGRPIRARDYRS